MKSLLIVRHAKSSWDLTDTADIDRPLNDRGKAEARKMAKKLIKRKIKIDAFLSSPAKRAKKTAKLFVEEFKRDKKKIIYIRELYEAPVSAFYEVVEHVSQDFDSVAIFSHNPGITDFARSLTPAIIDEMPTCGVFGIKIHADYWNDFKNADKEFWFFDYPKLK